MKIKDVKKGDLFRLKGTFKKEAMEVMEVWPNTVTLKCYMGSLNKPLEQLEKVENSEGFKIFIAPYFEDNR